MSRYALDHAQESYGCNKQRAVIALMFLPVAVYLLGMTGCGGRDAGRKRLEGTVNLEGQPLKEGQISFFPHAGTKGPSAGSPIVDGEFTIDAKKGLMMGKFRVEITAMRLTGRKIMAPPPDTGTVDEIEQYLPTRYNAQTELEAEVTEDGPNSFEYELKLK